MPDIYQFIKYNSSTSIESLKKKGESGAVICFDLEDSIHNWINGDDGRERKQEYRELLTRLLLNLEKESIAISTGIRINSYESGLQPADIDSIPSNVRIHSILIPKVENKNHIDSVVDRLNARNIVFNEIIPIIESRKGLDNLNDIISSKYKISKVGFGHCDYNLSIGAFPFFHQDSFEYWKWVTRILEVLKPNHIKFINSAYLSLNDSVFFQNMLSYLHFLCKDYFGQFTLSFQQTLLCNSFIQNFDIRKGIAKNRLDLGFDKKMLTNLTTSFETENKGQGFTLLPEKGILISPQEYCSAKQHLRNRREKDVNFTFVGGCFPVQGDILFEDIFHQTLKKDIEANLKVNFNVNIIRYERYSNCLDKIADYVKGNPVDYLVFHIRPEPFLRLIKLYYKYLDYDNKLCHSLNIPFLKVVNPEKYDILMLSRRYSYADVARRPKIYNAFINLNYLLGYLTGNYDYALNKNLSLVKEVLNYCKNRGIKLIILGPAIRSNVFIEAVFSKKLERFMSKVLKKMNVIYVFGLEKHQENNKKYFNNNGVHATKLYHDLIASRLFKEIAASIKMK
jgi:citrate lyase beta subunit